MGEAIARSLLPRGWIVLSAGLVGAGVDPLVARLLNEIDVDCSSQTGTALDAVDRAAVDDVFVLAAPAMPAVRAAFPQARIHDWSMADPLRADGGTARVETAVREARDEIRRRLRAWLDEHASAGGGAS